MGTVLVIFSQSLQCYITLCMILMLPRMDVSNWSLISYNSDLSNGLSHYLLFYSKILIKWIQISNKIFSVVYISEYFFLIIPDKKWLMDSTKICFCTLPSSIPLVSNLINNWTNVEITVKPPSSIVIFCLHFFIVYTIFLWNLCLHIFLLYIQHLKWNKR